MTDHMKKASDEAEAACSDALCALLDAENWNLCLANGSPLIPLIAAWLEAEAVAYENTQYGYYQEEADLMRTLKNKLKPAQIGSYNIKSAQISHKSTAD